MTKTSLSIKIIVLFIPLVFFLIHFDGSAQTNTGKSVNSGCIVDIGIIKADPCKHSFSFPARVNMSKGLIEVVIATPMGKTHESIFVTDVDPVTFEAAINMIGGIKTKAYAEVIKQPSDVLKIKHRKKTPDLFEIWVEYTDSLQQVHTCRIEDYIYNGLTNKPLEPCLWHFKGIPTDKQGNPLPYAGNNLAVSFEESDAVLEMNDPLLFDDNFLFANHQNKILFSNKDVIIHIHQPN